LSCLFKSQRLFENKPLIKNKKSFWVPPFFKKVVSFEAFWKNLHQKLFLFQYVIAPDFLNSLSGSTILQ